MTTPPANEQESFSWSTQPAVAIFVGRLVEDFLRHSAATARLAERLSSETGTRLTDWIDHFALPHDDALEAELEQLEFTAPAAGAASVWKHPGGIFPAVRLHDSAARQIVIGTESVADFLVAQHIDDSTPIEGRPLSPFRRARVAAESGWELWAVERHGTSSYEPLDVSADLIQAAVMHGEAFRRRKRHFARDAEGFAHAVKLIRAANRDIGADWASALFFATEREYWQARNRAARVQKARQDALGLGWANHDHHTYRSGRADFFKLIAALEELGLVCRERFYAGREAGWGAQVLEQPVSGIVVFADVDLSPDEVTGDVAHVPLPPQAQLGTVGLWCMLHGDAFLQAGMHHLECQFDFERARDQLRELGVGTMKPFTDFPFLRQAFTEGETWKVDESRLAAAHAGGFITADQADRFRQAGAMGSHLEILERNDGYKGFNQTGISEIIRSTDPRRHA